MTTATEQSHRLSGLDAVQTAAQHFVDNLPPAARLGLDGPLGAGKTTFTQALAHSLGVELTVDSPTFTLRQSYPITNHPLFKQLVHVDLYRLAEDASLEELAELGLLDDWHEPDTLLVIEWPNRVPALDPLLTHHLTFDWNQATDRRTLTINQQTGEPQ